MIPFGLDGVERITIIGCPGAGKSTLTRTLSKRLGLPAVHCDKLHWSAGWLDYPRRICMRRVLHRIRTTWGVVRPDMGDGCPEKLDPDFIAWVWNWHRDQRPGVLERFADVPQLDLSSDPPGSDETRLLWFRHPTQTARWLERAATARPG